MAWVCGIAGVIHRTRAAVPDELAKQLALLTHRGPDAEGIVVQGRRAVGQTRLAIIDLVTGDPPVTTPDGSIGVAFNGEIYTYAALRDELARRGHDLRTAGDTEVIAHLAEDHEPVDLARRLTGMFAIAISDDRRDRLVLIRDRLGKKPLFWTRTSDSIVFASEIKALLAHPDVHGTLDDDAIAAYLGFGYVPSPRTIYAGIQSVPPAHVMTVSADLDVSFTRYWAPPLPGVDGTEPLDLDLASAAAAVRSSLEVAVRRRLVADVGVGAFLSGGVDSTAIAALVAREAGSVRTFTIGFDDGSFDERPFARLAATAIGSDHHEFVVRPNAAELLETLVWHHDQPFGDSSALPTYLLSQVTREHVTVALTGDGGDELFCGYERLVAALVLGKAGTPGRAALRVGGALPSALPPKLARFARSGGAGLPHALRQWVAYAPDDVVEALVGPHDDWARRDYQQRWDATAGARTLDRILRLNLDTYLVDDLLPKADRMSMAHGLEVRSPFLDHELVELALRLPPRVKVRGRSLKHVLKRAVADVVPAEILERPKKGFGVPLGRWFREDLAPLVDARLLAPDARVREHVAGDVVARLVAEHRTGAHDRSSVLWSLLTLELFLRQHA